MKIITHPSWTKEEVEEFRASIKSNNGYCPCRIEHIPANKCMCQEFRSQVSGQCHCGLYLKED